MDRNFLLFIVLSLGILVLWQGFLAPAPPEPTPDARQPLAEEAPPAPTETPPPAAPSAFPPPAENETAAAPAPSTAAPPAATEGNAEAAAIQPERRITLRGAAWEAEFSSHGGAITRWTLTDYADQTLPGAPPVQLLPAAENAANGFDAFGETRDAAPLALATPLQGLGHGDLSRLDYEVSQPDNYTLVFTRNVQGVVVRKSYELAPDSYEFTLRLDVENGGGATLNPGFELRWPARAGPGADYNEFNATAYSQGATQSFIIVPISGFMMGGSASDQTLEIAGNVDWLAADSRYFIAAILPENPRTTHARVEPLRIGKEALLKIKSDRAEIPPGNRLDRQYKLYLGPKIDENLKAVGANLDEAILKGWFPSLTRFFTWLLEETHNLIPNYGWAIILITILVRVLMAPMMAKQMKSMKRISALQPEIKSIQQKYADDRAKQSEAMMAVYKKHGLSPFSMFGGCLPMLLQIPVFIGLYYALSGAITLRQQPFFGWMHDLSQPEALFIIPGLDLPVRVLPILMGGSMILQQKMSPTAMDPAQARLMLWMMPAMFTVLFYGFASGLVLYWLVSTLVGIGQQALTNRAK